MSVPESVFIALFLFLIVFLVLFCLYLCIRFFSMVLKKLERTKDPKHAARP